MATNGNQWQLTANECNNLNEDPKWGASKQLSKAISAGGNVDISIKSQN